MTDERPAGDPSAATGSGAKRSGPTTRTGAARAAAATRALDAIGRRAALARRLEPSGAEAVLSSVVDAAVTLFDAEAASLALHDPGRNVLVFRVAAGAEGRGVVGLEIPPDRGIAGYVFSTGQAIAIADVAKDERFSGAFAQSTGYVPRSIVAVPLLDEHGTLGVLEVLDKRADSAFSLRDVELAGVFARQATVAIRASRVERDLAALLRSAAASLLDSAQSPADVDALVAAATAGLPEDDDPLWSLVEQVAALRQAAPEQLELVTALLAVLVRQAGRRRGRRAGVTRRSGGAAPADD